MEEKLVGLLVGGLAVVAGDRASSMSAGKSCPLTWSSRSTMRSAMTTALVPGALGDRQRHGGRRVRGRPLATCGMSVARVLVGLGAERRRRRRRGHRPGGRRARSEAGCRSPAASAASGRRPASICWPSSRTSPAWKELLAPGDLGGELLQRDAVERELLGVGLDPDLGPAARRRCRSGRHRRASPPRPAARGRAGSGRRRSSDRPPPASATASPPRSRRRRCRGRRSAARGCRPGCGRDWRGPSHARAGSRRRSWCRRRSAR